VKTLTRFGVRGRLLLSFIGISGFAVLATVAAIYSFFEVGTLLDRVTEERVPTALAAQELSARVERIVGETPTLLAASTSDEQSRIWTRIGTEIEEIDKLLLVLRGHGFSTDGLASLQNVLDPFRSNLFSLNTLVSERIVLVDQKSALMSEMFKAHEDSLAVLGPWITNVNNDAQRLHTLVEDRILAASDHSTAKTELITSLTLLASLQQIQQEVTAAHEILIATASAEKHDVLELLLLRAQWSVEALGTLANGIGPQPRQLVLSEVEHFRQLIDGENNLPTLRARELTLIAKGDDVLAENAHLSRELTASVELLVGETKLEISQATSNVRTVQTRSSIILLLIVSLSLASSILIVWLYVDRNLVARLTALSNSMMAIARGNLKAALPPEGSDEIGGMAAALTVFRDTAIEVEEKNLREIAEARKRLIDAIESISEGFSLYDADDRLVVSNSTYRKLLYPGIEDVVVPGASFETIVREAAERGLVADANGRVEEWITDRLARHRNPCESHLQHRSDGRWILINERKTDDGGTVAVYADITELKEREEELAEKSNALEQKSNALEQLSNQLAKYLSPQIYESIFSGRQEVKVASSRKKLTIFFSDIVGFTETADRLESEELSQLLNQYLTEMSQIALDHGATIDKYVGDAIMIFLGDPETKGAKQDALACVKMAIAMRKKMNDLQDIWRESGIERPLRVRMGIHTGFCTVGNFGSEDRMDYTIIGGAVNTASRLENVATPGDIVISYETYALVRDQIHCEEHGQIEVKGIAYPIVWVATRISEDSGGAFARTIPT
jgi:class 3 adenylate cyclase/PAS domain-containing protein